MLLLLACGVLDLRRHPSGLEQFIVLMLMGYVLFIGALVWQVERRT
jgi:hypothetical protein